jgi:DNA-binding MurR/RpiR family transcriptional regulator
MSYGFQHLKGSSGLATVSIVVHQEWDLTERIAVGELTIADVMAELERFYSGPITSRILWDLSAATFNTLTSVDIERLSAAAAPLVKARVGGKSAVVAASDLGFGFSRMYQAYRDMHIDSLPYMSFRTRQEALDWLLSDAT